MPGPVRIAPALRDRVRQRAGSLCEYCHASEEWQYVQFTVDHVVPSVHSGPDDEDNLALACFHCNRRKSARTHGRDPLTLTDVPLWNPRAHTWPEHFTWSADGRIVIGLTPIGRATVAVLDLNRERVIRIREVDAQLGRHPPLGDPIQAVADF